LKQRLHLWLIAIRHSFVSLLPLTLLRVLGELVIYLPWPSYHQAMNRIFGENWQIPILYIADNSVGLFGFLLAATVATHLTYLIVKKTKEGEASLALMAALSAIINFIVVISITRQPDAEMSIHMMLIGILVGLASAEFITWAAKQPLLDLIKLPVEPDTTFYNAMRLTPTIMIGGILFFVGTLLWSSLPDIPNILVTINTWAQTTDVANWILSIIAVLINQLFWFFGIHGGLALNSYGVGTLFPIEALTSYNTDWAIRSVFDSFVLIGGSGATIGLIIAIFIVTKQGAQNKLAKFSVIPSIFNINDILIYGLPLILNPIYFLPFILVPLLLMVITLLAVQFGVIDIVVTNSVSWTTPPLISAWLLTESWRGVAIHIVEIAISTALYLPFVRKAENIRQQAENAAFKQASSAILNDGFVKEKIIERRDTVGMIARNLNDDLAVAIKQNELLLHYQPKHDKAGSVIGVEALIRWSHSRYGMVSPAMLINLAEDSGLIRELGRWVIHESFACKARWNQAGYGALTMAVNLSPQQLIEHDLPNYIVQCLHEFQLIPDELEFEITESSDIPDNEMTKSILQRITDEGFHLALDDFGMGYSSLLHLRRFQVGSIKIDGSITRDVLVNTINADIVKTITALGRAQNVKVIAEYVETAEQRLALEQMNCDIFQGYFHSPPLDEEHCLLYFKEHYI
jgi:lactose/cellobiose-specific phosphotransferase system IIC component